MSVVNYKALMANDVSIMNLSENEIFSSFIVIDQNNKQYYVGAYDLDHLSDFVNANEPVSDFSEFQDTLRNYFFSTASSESVPNTSNPDELLKCKHLTEFARQLNIKLDGGIDPKLDRIIDYVRLDTNTVHACELQDDIYKCTDLLSHVNSSTLAPAIVVKSSSFADIDVIPLLIFEFNLYQITLRPATYIGTGRMNSYEVAVYFRLPDKTTPRVVTGEVIFPETATYNELRIPVEITFTEE